MASISLNNVNLDIPILDVSRASLRKALIGRAAKGRFGESGSHVLVNALKRINFEARDGDRIGLIGDNGAGKSSFLRLVSGVYPPTCGTVDIVGHISPLFDATLGMSMDATGFENIQIAGTLWGMTRAQIRNSIDDIVDFTELGDFLGVPVRTYSSGMMLRLAFAIATAREPEILLIDEIIGVGDIGFFEKAFARLRKFAERSRILIVASHSDDLLRRLCDKAIWLCDGSVIELGDFDHIIAAYRSAKA